MDEPVADKGDLLDLDAYRQCGHSGDYFGSTYLDSRVVGVRHRNGIVTARKQCNRCGHVSSRQLPGRAEHLPLVVDGTQGSAVCERCGSTDGTEEHHWAPRGIFHSQADEWPTGWLCKACHAEWHRRMRAYGLREQPWGDD